MPHLTRILTRLSTSLLFRLILLALSATLLVAPLIGVGILLISRPLALRTLSARLVAPPEQGGISSPGFAPARQPGCQGQACFNQDPIKEDCVADAQTVASVPIIYDGSGGMLQITSTMTIQPGAIIGRLDRRYSPMCQAYWVRAFSFEPSGDVTMTLSYGPDLQLIDPKLPFDPMLSIYSDMTPTPQPATVIITLIDVSTRQFPMTATLG
jgi:hypothetical protein